MVVQRNGVVQGLDVMTGATRWSTSLRAGSSVGPVVDDGHAFVGLDDGRVVALDTETGRAAWTAAGTGPVTTIPTMAGKSVVVAHGTTVSAVDAATGASRWSTAVGGSGVTGTIAWSALGNRVIAVSPGVGMVGLHGGTGAVVWTLAGVRSPFAPTVPGGLIYAERETRDGTIVAAVGAAKGNVLRSAEPLTTAPSTGGMTLVGSTTGYLFSFTAGGQLQALAPSRTTGGVVWSQQVGASAAPIAAADGALYVVTNAGVLMRFAG